MSIGQMVVTLDLDGKKYKAGINVAREDLERFMGTVRQSSGGLNKHEQHVRSWGSSVRDTVIVLGQAREAFHLVNDVVLAFPRAVIRANAEIERMKALMIGMNRESIGFAAAQGKAEDSIDYLFKLSSLSPFAVEAVTDSFVKLKAAGLDPVNGSLQGVVDSIARFGGTSEHLKRASIAIQQMAGKGVISMEELRQQLGESIPNVMQIMSRALGMTMNDMVKKISSGTMGAKTALAALFKQMEIENSGSAAHMSETWDGLMNRLRNQWTMFLKGVGEVGAFDEAKDQLRLLVEGALADPRTLRLAHDLGQVMKSVIVGIAEVVKWLIEWGDWLLFIGKALLAIKVVQTFSSWGSAIALVSQKMQKSTRIVTAYNRAVIAQTNATKAQFGALAASNVHLNANTQALIRNRARMFALSQVARGLGRSLMASLGPIGLLVAGVWALTEAYRFVTKGKREFDRLMESGAMTWNAEDLKAQQVELDKINKEMKKNADTAARFQNAINKGLDAGFAQDNIDRLTGDNAALEKTRDKLVREITTAKENIIQIGAAQLVKVAEMDVSTALRPVRAKFTEELDRIKQGLLDQGIKEDSDEFYRKEREQHLVAQKEYSKALEAAWSTQITAKEAYLESQKDLSKTEQAQYTDAIIDLKERRDMEVARLQSLADPAAIIGGTGSSAAQELITKADAFLASIESRTASIAAKMKGAGVETAKFHAQLSTTYKDMSAEWKEAAKVAVAGLDAMTKAYKTNREHQKSLDGAEDIFRSLEQQVAGTEARLKNNNPFIQLASSAEIAKSKVSAVMEELEKVTLVNGASEAQAAQAQDRLAKMPDILRQLGDAQRDAGLHMMSEEVKEYERSWMTTTQRVQSELAEQERFVEHFAAKLGVSLSDPRIQAYLKALKGTAEEASNSMTALMKKWETDSFTVSDLWANLTEGMADNLTDFMVDGEANFADFLRNIAKMIIKSGLQKMIAGMISGMSDGPDAGATGTGGGFTDHWNAQFAKGGIMTDQGPVALKKYANGGVAYKPQLALFGEGDRPEAYVPLPDGRNIPVKMDVDSKASKQGVNGANVSVNVINQTGEPMTGESSTPRFDGEKFIIDVVMKKLSQPGSFRNAVKGAR